MLILTIDRYGYEIRRHIRHFKPFLLKLYTHDTDAFLINSNAKKCIRVAFDCFLFGILTLSVRLLLFFFVFNSHFLRKRKLTIFHKNSTKMLE